MVSGAAATADPESQKQGQEQPCASLVEPESQQRSVTLGRSRPRANPFLRSPEDYASLAVRGKSIHCMVFWRHLREWVQLLPIGREPPVSRLSTQIEGTIRSTSTSGLFLTILDLP